MITVSILGNNISFFSSSGDNWSSATITFASLFRTINEISLGVYVGLIGTTTAPKRQLAYKVMMKCGVFPTNKAM